MNFKKLSIRTLVLLLAISLFTAACAPQATATLAIQATPTPIPATPTTAPIALTDGLNREVTLAAPAQRIVSLAPNLSEILFAIGAGAQVVGRDEFSDYPSEVKSLPSVGGSMGKYDTEAVVNLKPDLVLAASINTPELVQSLEKLGLTVYMLPNPTTMGEMYQNLDTVAKLTGHEAEAANLIDSLKRRVAAVDSKIAAVKERPLVYYELDATDPNAPYTAGPGSFVDQLIQEAGGQNVGSILKDQWAQISVEQLIVKNPDIIMLGDAAYGVSVDQLKQRAGWSAIKAVQDGKIYTFDDNTVSRPGPRLVDGLETMAKLIHPELFK
jgi:iron complex transport system substrate-binding protein